MSFFWSSASKKYFAKMTSAEVKIPINIPLNASRAKKPGEFFKANEIKNVILVILKCVSFFIYNHTFLRETPTRNKTVGIRSLN